MTRDLTMTSIEGTVVRGAGRAADFTRIDWVRQQLMRLAGIDPHPGTLNLRLEDRRSRQLWQEWRTLPGLAMASPDPAGCHARCYPARIAGGIPAAVILPEVADYPEDRLELVAALPIRQHLMLEDGARLQVALCRPLKAEAILFDIDGTLVDSARAYLEVARVAARPHGLEVSEQHVRNSLASGSNFWRDVVPADRPDCESIVRSMTRQAHSEWPRVLREHGRVFDGLFEVLAGLRQQGRVLGIVSGAHPAVLELLGASRILDSFDAIVLGADVTRPKPDPEGILKCLAQLGIAPAAAIYVGDTPVDIQASRAAGVYSVGVLTGAGNSASMSAQAPDRLLYSLAGLADCIDGEPVEARSSMPCN